MSPSYPSKNEVNFALFCALLEARAPYLSNSMEKMQKQFGNDWQTELATDMAKLFTTKSKLDDAINGYIQFVLETARLQNQFTKTGKYPVKTHAAANERVFANNSYMSKIYLPGVLLINYLWPHQYALKQHFTATFVKKLRSNNNSKFLDIGVGSGYFSRVALTNALSAFGTGYDISRPALEFAQNHMEYFDVGERWSGQQIDILNGSLKLTWDFIMSIEILHLFEEPVVLLNAIRDRLNKGGIAYITTALNAAEADAVYIYRVPEEVEYHLTVSGFTIIDRWKIAAPTPKSQTIVPYLVSYLVTLE